MENIEKSNNEKENNKNMDNCENGGYIENNIEKEKENNDCGFYE